MMRVKRYKRRIRTDSNLFVLLLREKGAKASLLAREAGRQVFAADRPAPHVDSPWRLSRLAILYIDQAQ